MHVIIVYFLFTHSFLHTTHPHVHARTQVKLPVKDTLKDQLKVIGDYMMDMRDITSNYSKREAQQQKKK